MPAPIARLFNFVSDSQNSIPISSTEVDAELDQLVDAINAGPVAQASAPASPVEGDLWYDTTNNVLKAYDGSSWVATGDVFGPATNTDLNVPQWDGTDSKTLKDGLAVGTSANNLVQLDSNAKLPAVDGSQLTGVLKTQTGLGTWESKSVNTAYLAETDGFVLADNSGGNSVQLWGYSDSSNPPTTVRIKGAYNSGIGETGRLTMPVRKGDYWKVTGSPATERLFWISIGA